MDKLIDPQSNLEYAGITNFPESSDREKNASKLLAQKRDNFYTELAKKFPHGKVYYPGSGPDPIPFRFFGERIVYGSLNEAKYLEWLKTNDGSHTSAYKDAINNTKGLDTLKAVYADIRKSPFPDKTFKIIFLNAIPIELDEETIEEIKRLLDDDGVLVYENTSKSLEDVEKDIKNLSTYGMAPSKLDKSGGITNVRYSGYLNGRRVFDDDGTPFMFSLSKDQFVEKLRKHEPVKMKGHEFRVFKKSSS